MCNSWEDSRPFQVRETCIGLIYQWLFGMLQQVKLCLQNIMNQWTFSENDDKSGDKFVNPYPI